MGEVHLGPRDEVRAKDAKRSKPSNTVRIKQKKQVKKEIGRNSGLTLIILAFVFGSLSMFVGQAALQFKHFTGKDAPIELMRDVLKQSIGAVKR